MAMNYAELMQGKIQKCGPKDANVHFTGWTIHDHIPMNDAELGHHDQHVLSCIRDAERRNQWAKAFDVRISSCIANNMLHMPSRS